jgi:murein DD-endopeptidase MepM/ murein hydrolase activator NlpD
MNFALRFLLAAAMLMMGGCYYTPAPYDHHREAPRHTARAAPNAYAVYSVRPGDTLYSIAKRFGINYRLLARRNRIGYPYTIYVGQELFLTRMAPPSERIPTPREVSRSPGPSRPAPAEISPPDRGYARMRLIWPVKGTITSGFGNEGHRMHDGIDIAAPRGTPVRAAAAGEVVYSDNRLAGYGRLIIIRHAGDLFTAYAHNERNLVSRGDKVKQGEIIARVGETGRASGPHLHFEVRRGPTPVDPLAYLPRQ